MLALQTSLTDAMITEKLSQVHGTPLTNNLIAIIAVAAAALLGLLLCYFKFRRSEGDLRKLMLSVMALCAFGGIGAEIFLLNMRSTYSEIAAIAKNWYVRESVIESLDMDVREHRHSKNGRTYYTTTVTYTAEFSGISGEVTLTEGQYKSYSEGDEVYLVMNSVHNIEVLYQMYEYEYTGNRLK